MAVSVSPASVFPCTLTTLYIANLSPLITREDILQHFSPFGDILYLRIMRDSRAEENPGYGFIEFATSQSMRTARQIMNGRLMQGFRLQLYRAQMLETKAGESFRADNAHEPFPVIPAQIGASTAQA